MFQVSLPRYHGVVKTVVGQAFMAFDAGVAERRVFIAPECEHSLVHVLGVEHLEVHQQVKIFYRQARHGQKQVRLNLRDHVLQLVLAEISQIHERRDARGELDELFLNQLPLGFVFFFLLGQLLLLLLRQLFFLRLVFQPFHHVALVDDGFDDVVAERAPAFDAFHGGHRFGIVEDAAQGVVVHIHQQRALPFAREQRGRRSGHCDVEDAARVNLRHVRAVVGQHGQEGHEVFDGVFGIGLAGRKSDAVFGELPQRPRRREIEYTILYASFYSASKEIFCFLVDEINVATFHRAGK